MVWFRQLRPGEWVACRQAQRVTTGKSKEDLLEKLRGMGITRAVHQPLNPTKIP